ncbi:MAG: Gfo/Idh/MocA family protein [Cetobacterium sp.]
MLNIAVVGTSKITHEFVDAIGKTEGCRLKAVYSRNYEKGLEFGKQYSVEDIITDFEILKTREDIDAVYVASPNSLHFKQTIKLLKEKKNVLCEKPMGVSEEEVIEMYRVARENRVTLMEAMKNTFLPNFKSIRDNLYKIGEVRTFFGNFSQYSSRYDSLKNGEVTNIFNPEFGGGAHLDLGVYPLYFALRLFGIPSSTRVMNYNLSTKVPGAGTAILEYENMVGTILYSKITPSIINSEIAGENGSIIIESISNIDSAKIYYKNGVIEDITLPQAENSMIYELEEFLTLVKLGKVESEVNTEELSRAVIKILTKKD